MIFGAAVIVSWEIMGPPIALLMRGHDPVTSRATVAATGVVVTATTAVVDVVLHPSAFAASALLTAYTIPGMLLGLALSRVPRSRISDRVQSVGILVVSAGAAAVLLVHSSLSLAVSSGT